MSPAAPSSSSPSVPWTLLAGAAAIRAALMMGGNAGSAGFSSLYAGLSSRPEAATPVNSRARLAEGAFLYSKGASDPYSGVVFHEPPLMLWLFSSARDAFASAREKEDMWLDAAWIAMDLATALVLYLVAVELCSRLLRLRRRAEEPGNGFHDDAKDLLAQEGDPLRSPRHAAVCYLFNPYTLLSCVARTSTVVDNLLTAAFLLCALKRRRAPACFFLAALAYKSFYPVMLLVPLCLMIEEEAEEESQKKETKKSNIGGILATVLHFSFFLAALLWVSYKIMGDSWSFLAATYGFVLSVPELTPNMGLFWYFFTEMFDHFRVFFVCTFQLNTFVYVIPLTLRLRRRPYVLCFSLLALTAIFKSYPSYGDVGLYVGLLPTLQHLFPYTKQLFFSCCMFAGSTALGPIVHHLWVYAGSANANYFFAINLVFGTAQIFLLTDLLFAHVKREFYLKNGYKELQREQKDGEEDSKKPQLRLVLK